MTPDELYAGMTSTTWGMEVEAGTDVGSLLAVAEYVRNVFVEEWPREPDMPPITVQPLVREAAKVTVVTSDPAQVYPELRVAFVHDASIPYPIDVEVNSPPYFWRKEHIRHWRTVMRALRNYGVKCGGELPRGRRTCGLHIHIDSRNMTPMHVRNLIYTFWTWEPYIIAAVNPYHERLRYARPLTEGTTGYVGDQLVDRLKKIGGQITEETLADSWYNTYTSARPRLYKYHESRYHIMNLHSHWYRRTIEFRIFNSTTYWFLQSAYLQLCYALVLNAMKIGRAVPSRKEVQTASAKYDFRVFLLRLGLIGDRFKNTRKQLLRNLPGSAAWKSIREEQV